jgi:hypothetical protein
MLPPLPYLMHEIMKHHHQYQTLEPSKIEKNK